MFLSLGYKGYGQEMSVLDYEKLFEAGCTRLENSEIDEGETILLSLEKFPNVPQRIRQNVNIVLANLYADLGEAEALQSRLLMLKDYLQQNPGGEEMVALYNELSQVYASLLLYSDPFEERMCGLWVSANSIGLDGAPVLALAVYKDSTDNYVAEINKSCYFAKEFSTSDYYEKHLSNDLTFLGGRRQMSAFFGDERLRKSRPELAAAGIAATNQLTRSISQSISVKNKKNLNSVSNTLAQTANDVAGMALSAYIASLAVAKNHVKVLEITCKEEIPGMLTAYLDYDYYLEQSNGKNSEEHYTRRLNLYKIMPQDSILFISPSAKQWKPYIGCPVNWIQGFSDDEIAAIDKLGIRKKEKAKLFNKESYNKLYEKVRGNISQLPQEFVNDSIEKSIEFDFKYSVQNQFFVSDIIMRLPQLSYGNFSGIVESVFPIVTWVHPQKAAEYVIEKKLRERWYSMCGEWFYLPSYGTFKSENRDEKRMDYEGEWLKKRFHGHGTLTTSEGTYTGEFVKGKRHGKGCFVDTAGNVQEGIWEKDKLVETKKL